MLTLLVVAALMATDFQLVLTDGSALEAQAPPRVESGLAVVALVDGLVVSVPEKRIDWAATAAANERRARAAAAAAAEPAAVDGGVATTGRRRSAPLLTNREIEAYADLSIDSAPVTGAAASVSVAAPSDRPGEPPLPPRPPQDDLGRPPEYWAERARAMRDEVRRAELGLEAAEAALADEEDALVHGRTVTGSTGLTMVYYGNTGETLAAIQFRISALRERVTYARLEFEEARQREADLREEARVAGAQPGWLRLPVSYR